MKQLDLLKQLVIELFKKCENNHDIDAVISKDSILIKIFRKNTKEIYKKIKVEKQDNKFKILILPDKISKLVNMSELDEIITIIEKQSQIIKHTPDEIEEIKNKYKTGTKIKLIKQYDLQAVHTGSIGSVEFADDVGNIHMNWENGRTLALIPNLDEFIICKN